jgi:hypothetical protein
MIRPVRVVLVRTDGQEEPIPFTWDAEAARVRYLQPVTIGAGESIKTDWEMTVEP